MITRALVERQPFDMELRLHLLTDDAKRLRKDGWDDHKPHSPVSYSGDIYLSEQAAQELANALYDCGVMASKARGSIGQLEAVKYHLEDMRKIVFSPITEGVSK